MEDRIKDAERWVSKKLTDDETILLNKALGIDAEVLAAMADEDDEVNSKVKKRVNKTKRNENKNNRLNRLSDLSLSDSIEARKIRGFLELNPYICSGCGTPFQSTVDENPGYLPKEKFHEHRKKAELIKDKQEAIKILDMAGIELNSDAAENILRSAGISSTVISGVRSIGYESGNSAMDRDSLKKDIQDVDNEYTIVVPQDLESFDNLKDNQRDLPSVKEVKDNSISDNVCI